LPRVTATDSERYWDERARENALYFVDNEIGYDDPDTDAFWRRGEQVVERMLGMAGVVVGPDETVLDIGCGVGRLTRTLAARAGRVYGLDVSREMLELAKQHNPRLDNVEWLHGDGKGLGPVSAASVDGCFSHVVFQHLPAPELTLGYVREMGRVLRPGGWTAFGLSTDPAVHRPRRRAGWRLAALLGRGPRGQEHPAWLGSAVPLDRLERCAEEAGLDLERVLHPGAQFTLVRGRRRA
jgi:SAM-dependent methyltransferase